MSCMCRIGVLFFLCWFFLSAGATSDQETASRCGTLAQISQELWANDVNRLDPEDITLNYQSQIRDGSKSDRAGLKLFASVNESKLAEPTFRTFLALLDNYEPDKGQAETLTDVERDETSAFLEAVVSTDVSSVLEEYLMCAGIIESRSHLISVLNNIWFDFYPRSSSSAVNDSSGFEHVMVGEYKSTSKVNGFHNWLSFYRKERSGHLNYLGYVTRREPSLIGPAFKWNGRFKSMGTLFVGVSPEFDMAIYTLCYMIMPNRRCRVVINDNAFHIQTHKNDGHISTAYAKI